MAQEYSSPPEMGIDPTKQYEAVFHTSEGEMRIKLYADAAPITVNNFVFLAREGFYNDTLFHRVIPEFMAQGGDPTGTGRGGPGYRFDDEEGALRGKHSKRGILSMANAGPNTNGSQFFITHGPTPHLDGKHGVFGEVVEGEDVLMAIQVRDPQRGGPATDLKRIDIIER